MRRPAHRREPEAPRRSRDGRPRCRGGARPRSSGDTAAGGGELRPAPRRAVVPTAARSAPPPEHVGHRLPGERPAARQQLEDKRPERPDVRPLVHPPAASLLGRHVARGPEDHSRLRARLRHRRRLRQIRRGARGRVSGIGLGQAEVEHLDSALGCELHVGRLQVAVDDPLLVRCLEPSAICFATASASSTGTGPFCDPLCQRLAFNQFQHQEAFLLSTPPPLLQSVEMAAMLE